MDPDDSEDAVLSSFPKEIESKRDGSEDAIEMQLLDENNTRSLHKKVLQHYRES